MVNTAGAKKSNGVLLLTQEQVQERVAMMQNSGVKIEAMISNHISLKTIAEGNVKKCVETLADGSRCGCTMFSPLAIEMHIPGCAVSCAAHLLACYETMLIENSNDPNFKADFI